jgi:hypothetical protein
MCHLAKLHQLWTASHWENMAFIAGGCFILLLYVAIHNLSMKR